MTKLALAIDCSEKECQIAFFKNAETLFFHHDESGRPHSTELLPLLASLQKDLSIDFNELSYLACIHGPGSFTGLRVALSSLKAIAYHFRLPICVISSLKALFLQNEARPLLSLIYARADELFYGKWDDTKEDYVEGLCSLSDLDEAFLPFQVSCFGSGALQHKSFLEQLGHQVPSGQHTTDLRLLAPHFYHNYCAEDFVSARDLDVNYLRSAYINKQK